MSNGMKLRNISFDLVIVYINIFINFAWYLLLVEQVAYPIRIRMVKVRKSKSGENVNQNGIPTAKRWKKVLNLSLDA